MNNNKKWNASRHQVVVAGARKSKMASVLAPSLLERCDASHIMIDPKRELAAVILNRAKKSGGVMALNPFVVLPQPAIEACSKWFRLSVATAISDLTRMQRKGRQ